MGLDKVCYGNWRGPGWRGPHAPRKSRSGQPRFGWTPDEVLYFSAFAYRSSENADDYAMS